MAVVKTMRLVRNYGWNVKTIIFVSVHDKPVQESVIVGPTGYFTRRVLVVTNRDLSEAEVDRLVAKVLGNHDRRCHRCHLSGPYLKIDIKNGEPDFSTAVCGQCDPHIAYALGLYEAIDIAFIETRGN
jgi:flavoprotein